MAQRQFMARAEKAARQRREAGRMEGTKACYLTSNKPETVTATRAATVLQAQDAVRGKYAPTGKAQARPSHGHFDYRVNRHPVTNYTSEGCSGLLKREDYRPART